MALLFTGLVLAAGAAFTPPATMAAQTSAPRTRTRRICRDVSRVGSRLRSYRCLTEAEWTDVNRQNADNTRETQDDAQRNIRADVFDGPTDLTREAPPTGPIVPR